MLQLYNLGRLSSSTLKAPETVYLKSQVARDFRVAPLEYDQVPEDATDRMPFCQTHFFNTSETQPLSQIPREHGDTKHAWHVAAALQARSLGNSYAQ